MLVLAPDDDSITPDCPSRHLTAAQRHQLALDNLVED
jgi:hypothetical protein